MIILSNRKKLEWYGYYTVFKNFICLINKCIEMGFQWMVCDTTFIGINRYGS